jgi:type I restriction-modification system DNA methylase subunit
MYGRERTLQDELYRLIADIAEGKRFAGLTLSVQTEFPVDRRRADVVVLKKPDEIPVLVIETKRKVERRGYYRREELFDPYGRAVVGQALSYAALVKEKYNLPATPAFATANREVIVVFSPVVDPSKYLNWKAVEEGDYENALGPSAYVSLIHEHYLLDEKNPLREELLQYILDQVARIWQREVLPEAVRKRPGDWLLGKLRYFVDTLSRYYVTDVLRARLMADDKFAAELNALAVKAGYKNGLTDIVGEDYSRAETLARMMVYVLMNKIIFYKVLERHYKLDELKPILEQNPNISSEGYLDLLNQYFSKAISVTGDFEQIFITGLYDHVILSQDRGALMEIDELIRLLSEIEIERLGDIIGYIYEDLITAEERHKMGQFYTPQPIAELIARWCINGNPSALILGPGCGSGTFEVEAYWILSQLKTGRKRGIPPGKDVHRDILKQIYALDINPFPTQLTAMNLAMKNVRAPTTEANIVTADFFSIAPGQKVIAPYLIMTPTGPRHKEIVFPKDFDVIMGNPPYTRWGEIPEDVQHNIIKRVGKLLESYDLLPVARRRGAEYTMVVFWIAHSLSFLKDGGRLGMIVSDSWLQTAYGIRFGRLLADHFKICAIIDIASRVFPVPLVGACIILLEKCLDDAERDSNVITFAYLNIKKGRIDVSNVLKAIEDKKPNILTSDEYDIIVNVYKQNEVRRSESPWITFLFNASDVLNTLRQHKLVTKLETYFEPTYGNIVYTILYTRRIVRTRHAGVGGEEFFYLTEDIAGKHKIPREYLYHLLPSSRYMNFFTFTEDDWMKLKNEGTKCYLFVCHRPRHEIPQQILEYIKLGETELKLLKGIHRGEPVSRSRAAEERKKLRQYFFDWYDLGGVVETPIYVARGSQYWVRFVLAKYQCALDDRILALIPIQGVEFDEVELKALLAYLNSSFAQLQAEVMGRSTGGGMMELDVKPLRDFVILDVKRLPRKCLEELAKLFEELEAEVRKLGGADEAENIFGSELAKELTGKERIKGGIQGLFNTVIRKIDEKVASILEAEALVELVRTMVVELARRRLARGAEAKPSALKGSEEQLYRRSGRKGARIKESDTNARTTRLTDFM